jgi:DNA-binding CsgD family transcriptional regulator
MDLDEFDQLVGRIYEAAQQPDEWGSVLTELGGHIGLDKSSLQRPPQRGHLSPDQQQRLGRLMPHLTRAFQLSDALHAQQQQFRAASAALETTPLAVISLDAAGHVWHGNTRGAQLLKAGDLLRIEAGTLTAANTSDESQFANALQLCARTSRPTMLMLTRRDAPAERFSITLLKPADTADAALPPNHSGTRGLLCLVSPLTRRRLPTAHQLITLFKLTPAEARLTRAVASGESLEDYAQANGTKLSTVRTQLRSVFNKTGTDRQTSLVRAILGVPVVRDPMG